MSLIAYVWILGVGALNSESVSLTPRGGIKLEPVVGILMNDSVEENKSVVGLRGSFFYRDISDASIAVEAEALAATQWTGATKTPESDYLFQFGPAVYEFYEPWAFRVGAGMTTEINDAATSLGIYYRGALGYYFFQRVGAYVEATGLFLFRSAKLSLPLQLGATFQISF